MYRFAFLFLISFLALAATAAETLKRLPPQGIPVPEEVRDKLANRVKRLQSQLEKLSFKSPDADRWEPDVEVLLRAVRLALQEDLFFKKNEPKIAGKLLNEAARRLTAAENGKRGLALLGLGDTVSEDPQLLVGGFRSRIDDSVQPFGLVVPAGYMAGETPWRVDVWLHGRGDTKTEIPFLNERMTKVGLYAPQDTFVLHPFGRHCNAFKFAGETDVDEALEHIGLLLKESS